MSVGSVLPSLLLKPLRAEQTQNPRRLDSLDLSIAKAPNLGRKHVPESLLQCRVVLEVDDSSLEHHLAGRGSHGVQVAAEGADRRLGPVDDAG